MDLTPIRQNRSILVAQVEKAGVELKKAGSRYVGRCCFHEDKDPSFSVYQDKSGAMKWRCFGACNKGGDIFDFLKMA